MSDEDRRTDERTGRVWIHGALHAENFEHHRAVNRPRGAGSATAVQACDHLRGQVAEGT